MTKRKGTYITMTKRKGTYITMTKRKGSYITMTKRKGSVMYVLFLFAIVMYVIFLFVIVMYVLFRFAIVMYVLLVSSNISNSACSLKEHSADRHGPVVHINLIPHQPVFDILVHTQNVPKIICFQTT
jgi:hypothetical protein